MIDNIILPEFTEIRFREKRNKYCLLMPNFNEGERLNLQTAKMQKLGIFDIVDSVICDAGSTDGSADPEKLRASGLAALLVRHGNGRYSTDIRMGMGWAYKNGYEGVITVDCNNKDDTSAMKDFIAKLDEGYDYVQGSRFIKGGHHENTPFVRLWAMRLIMMPLMTLGAHKCISDGSNGFKAYSMKFLTDERVNPFRDIFNKYELVYYLPSAACRMRFKTTEIPVTRIYPKNEKVPTKSGFKDNWATIIIMLRLLFGGYQPKR